MKQQKPARWQFRINAEMLPSYIPTRVADKVGNSVSVIFSIIATKFQRLVYMLLPVRLP